MKVTGILLIGLILGINAIGFFTVDSVHTLAVFSQFLGASALILMALGQVIATRVTGVEALFGSLDQSYKLHKWLGIGAFALFLLHDVIDADIDGERKGVLYGLAETMGELSFNGLIFLIVLSIVVFIPYHLWKWTHRFMGALFALAALHFILIDKPFAVSEPIGLYVSLFCLLGVIAYLYTLLPQRFRAWKGYKVVGKQQVDGVTVLEVAPVGNTGVKHRAGQFAFISVDNKSLLEPHPFTISSAPNSDGTLRLSIKALGDFTDRLGRSIEVGDRLKVQGAYGHFIRQPSDKTEVWIAGGIGITPFASWAQALATDDPATIHLFYSMQGAQSAVHLDELRAKSAQLERFHLHIIDSSKGERLSVDQISGSVSTSLADAQFYFCGPKTMRVALKEALAGEGVRSRHYRFEEFELRSGIGLRHVFKLLLDRLHAMGYVSAPMHKRLLQGLG